MNHSDNITTQLKRINGQVAALLEMYQEEQSCVKIVQQTLAASNSLRSVAKKILSAEAKRCSKERRIEDLDAVIQEVFRY